MISRRDFVRQTGTGLALASLAPIAVKLRANPLGMPIGFQCYDARRVLRDDYAAGWRQLTSYGFRTVDLVSFAGYGYEGSPLAKMSAKEILGPMNEAGITAENCQYEYSEL